MRKTVFSIILIAAFTGCGGSGSSSLGGNTIEGNFVSTTVEVERRFLYALNEGEGSVSGFLIASEEEGGHDHDHDHAGRILGQNDHGDDHDHEGEGEETEGLELEALDSSPYTFGGAPPIDMAVDGTGQNLYLLDAAGNLRGNPMDGLTGLLTIGDPVATGVANPRFLRLSDSGNALAVVGDDLAIFAIDADGQLSDRAFLDGTEAWSDVRLSGDRGVGATETGAVGFLWIPGAVIDPRPEVTLPGGGRGQIAYAALGIFVVNGEDVSVSQLSQDEEGFLTLETTFALPDELTDPRTLATVFDGEDLLVGDSDSVVLLHPHDDELEEEGHADLDQTPTVLFPLPESNFVLVGHAQGEGYHLLELGEEGLEVLGEFETEYQDVSAFGYAERVERVTEVVRL
jgi:hypothetical protein